MSYLDRKNVLKEGLVDMILKSIFKKSVKKLDKKVQNNPKYKKAIKDIEKAEKQLKALGF